MDYSTIIIIFSLCIGASFIQRVSGFGFGIFVMTVFPHVMNTYGEATALSGLLSMALAFYVVVYLRKYITLKKHLPILITFTLVSYISISYVSGLNDKFLKQILGGVLVFSTIYFFCISERIKLKPTIPIQIIMGTVSGIMGGIFAMPGPPAVLYFIASEKTKEQYLAGIQVYFFISNVMMSLFRFKAGFITSEVGYAWGVGIIGVIIGAFIGAKIFRIIPIQLLRKIIYIYMAFSGILALVC